MSCGIWAVGHEPAGTIAVQYNHGFDNLLVDDTSSTEVNNQTWTLLAGFGL